MLSPSPAFTEEQGLRGARASDCFFFFPFEKLEIWICRGNTFWQIIHGVGQNHLLVGRWGPPALSSYLSQTLTLHWHQVEVWGTHVPPMISSLPHKHLCGADYSEPHVTGEKTEAQRDDMIVYARAQPVCRTHLCGPKTREILNSELKAFTCFA